MRSGSRAPVVVVDLDEVLLDFQQAWRDCARMVLQKEMVRQSDAYLLSSRYGLTEPETLRVWEVFHEDAWWERVPPQPDVWDFIAEMDRVGVSLWAVTNVDPQWGYARALSLGGAIPEGRIVCLGAQATAADRAEVLRRLRATAFLDDLPENVNAAVSVLPCAVHLNRNYADRGVAEHPASVIDHLLDFPVVLESMFRQS